MNTFSIKELENLTGIKAHTLRAWEKRYGILSPARSQGKNRIYSIDELKKVLAFSLLANNGHKVSSFAGLSDDSLEQKIVKIINPTAAGQKAVNGLVICMYCLDPEGFEKIINNCFSTMTDETVLKEIIFSFLVKTNLLWEGNRLIEEHFVVTILRSKIILAIERCQTPAEKGTSVLLFVYEASQLDLILLFTKYLLKRHGIKVVYLGSNISAGNLRSAIQAKMPDYVFTSLPRLSKAKVGELAHLMEQISPGSRLIIAQKISKKPAQLTNKNVSYLDYSEAIAVLCS